MFALRDTRGSALIFALGFMTVVLVIALGIHSLVGVELRSSGAQRRRVAATYLAKGGLARAIGWFRSAGYRLPQATLFTNAVPVKLASNNAAVLLPGNHPDKYTDTGGTSRNGVVSSFNSYLTSQTVGGGKYSVTASLMGLVSGNGLFHYDQALQNVATAPGPLRLVAQWTAPS